MIVERDEVDEPSGLGGNAGPKRDDVWCRLSGGIPALDVGLPHHLIGESVESALHDHDPLTTRESPSRTKGAHDGLSTGVGKADLLDVWTHGLDCLHDCGVQERREARDGALGLNGLNHGAVYSAILVSQDDGTVAQPKIHKLSAVTVRDSAALDLVDPDGIVLTPVPVVLGHTLRHVLVGFQHALSLRRGCCGHHGSCCQTSSMPACRTLSHRR